MNKLFNKVEMLLLKNPSNLFYFSKYKNEDAVVILLLGESFYLTDSRYIDEAKQRIKDFEIVDTERDLWGKISKIVQKYNIKTIGIENDLPMNFYFEMTSKLNYAKFEDISTEISDKRSLKSLEEIELIRLAQKITDKTFLEVLPEIKEGISEFELSRILENLLYKNGATGLAFDSIIAFGKNAARPHAHPSNAKLKNNQFIKIDFGASFQGYCSDMTRTVAFGKVSSREIEIYNIVLEAQQIALQKVYTGIPCKDAYNLANDIFKKYNLDKWFIHSLGHGLGTDVHEMPTLSPKSTQTLEENMVVSIEPGLYFSGEFGVRIEDIIVFKKSIVENLTNSEKQLIML